jgi:predicted dehydrogenase
MAERKLRAGVVGLVMGQWHAARYYENPNVDLVAVADLREERLRTVGDKYEVPNRYADAGEMIAKESLDILSIATPNKFHRPYAVAALESGAHVLCEKPMATNAAEAKMMLDAAEKAGRRIMINFSYRFHPQSWAMKQEAEAGMLGDIYFARTIWHRRRGIPGLGGWFGQKDLAGGGPLIDLGVHRLDLALWLMEYPKPTWVLGCAYDHLGSAKAGAEGKMFDVEDLAVGLIRFDNGASIALEASWMADIKEREMMETRFLGTRGGMLQRNTDEGYGFEMEVFFEKDGQQYDLKRHEPLPNCPGAMDRFVDCILNNKPHPASGAEGYRVMQILDALYESAATARPVQIE